MEIYEPVYDAVRQIELSCEKMKELTIMMENAKNNIPELEEVYKQMRIDELEHIQMMVLVITQLLNESNNSSDGSAFFSRELNA